MADLRIADAPEIDESEVQGGLKIPTGGFGNKAINMTTVASWVVKDKDLPSKGYVDDKFNQGNQGLAGHVANKNNPHEVTKEQIGLGNVDNTADVDKPVSNAASAALNLKADKSRVDVIETDLEDSKALFQYDGKYEFDAVYAEKIGGYPLNARIMLSSGEVVQNTQEGNTTNPNISMVGWKSSAVLKDATVPTYKTATDGVNPVTGVVDGDYFNVRSEDDDTVAIEYQNVGGSAVATGKSCPSDQYIDKTINANAAVKFLKAANIGLTKWDEFKKPPYSEQEYEQAYNNGVNLSLAIKAANEDGYSKVVLERGNYPVCYNRGSSEIQAGSGGRSIVLKDISNFEFDLNGSTFFVIFDSINRSPYDKSTYSVYSMSGWVITPINTKNLVIRNGQLRGDMYNRAWVAGESSIDNTVGIQNNQNNRFLKITDLTISGFRADSLGGAPRGYALFSSLVWSSGAYDATTGAPISTLGAYSTQMLELSSTVGGQSVLDNCVQIMTSGYTREPLFRSEFVRFFFYAADGSFISSQLALPTADVVIPTRTAKLIITAYEDERTTPTVDYGTVWLVTGSSSNATIERCTFFANNRGGVANFGSNTTIRKCKMFDFGAAIEKYGFKAYTDPTVYGVNFEDVYNSGVVIDNNTFNNTGRGVIAITQDVKYINNRESNNLYANTIYSTRVADIKDNTINGGGGIAVSYGNVAVGKRMSQISGNTVIGGSVIIKAPINNLHVVSHLNNTYFDTLVEGEANDNLISSGNIYKELRDSRSKTLVMRGLKSFDDFIDKPKDTAILGSSGGWRNIHISLKRPKMFGVGEFLFDSIVTNTAQTLTLSDGEVYNSPALNVVAPINKRWLFGLNISGFGTEHVDKFNFTGSSFENIELYFGASASRTFCNTEITFNSVQFKNSYLNLSKNDTTDSQTTIHFKNCVFDCDGVSEVVRVINNSASLSTTTILFENCTFRSQVLKSFRYVNVLGEYSLINSMVKFEAVSNLNIIDTTTTIFGSVSITYDPPPIDAGETHTTTVTLTGVVVGNIVQAAFSRYNADIEISAVVSASNTVTVKFKNIGTAPIDLASGTLTVKKL